MAVITLGLGLFNAASQRLDAAARRAERVDDLLVEARNLLGGREGTVLIAQPAEGLSKEGPAEQARQKIARALNLDPENSQALGLMGVYYLLVGDLVAAEDFLSRATARAPADVLLLYNRGLVSRSRGDARTAIEYWDRAAKIGEKHIANEVRIQIYESLSDVYSELGEYQHAYEMQRRLTAALRDASGSLKSGGGGGGGCSRCVMAPMR